MSWYYKDKELTEEDIGSNIGFVYLITNLVSGRKYIGKKLFKFSKRKQIKKKKKRVLVTSDWNDYYGSSDILKNDVVELGKENFKREILHLCSNKTQMSYMELKEQIERKALESDDFYNIWIMVRVRKIKDLLPKTLDKRS